ncbi:MAG TPA: hypothetical protein VFR76_12260, partial [Verrucomicrobiae bacterium]|nr:hypothetical protein [Verrucomicrobiae bacterium]
FLELHDQQFSRRAANQRCSGRAHLPNEFEHTKEEISQNWWFLPWENSAWGQQKDREPGDHYP